MSKQRYINTKLWSDNWVANLDPVEKLLFLYLLTNERTNICGVYELPLKLMAVETGIEKEMIIKVLDRFEEDRKVMFREGWVSIINFVKHQDSDNPKIKKGIETVINEVPLHIRNILYIPYTYLSDNININNNNNINKNTIVKKDVKKDDLEVILPDWLNKEVWKNWEDYKKERKQKLTPLMVKQQLKLLEENKSDYKEIIEQSIRNGWTGLFALKNKDFAPKVYKNTDNNNFIEKLKAKTLKNEI